METESFEIFFRIERLMNGRNRKKLANNTYARKEKVNGLTCLIVRLHSTDIVQAYTSKTIYSSGGWLTPTTKNRINEYLPSGFRLYSERGQWILQEGDWETGTRHYWQDGLSITDGVVQGALPPDEEANKRALRNRIKAFCRRYMENFQAGRIESPGSGDCMICSMFRQGRDGPEHDVSHLDAHMEENYYVPSLLHNAMKAGPASPAMWWAIASKWEHNLEEREKFAKAVAHMPFLWKDVQKRLERYMLRSYGMR